MARIAGSIFLCMICCAITYLVANRGSDASSNAAPDRSLPSKADPNSLVLLAARNSMNSEMTWELRQFQSGPKRAANSAPILATTTNGEPAAFHLPSASPSRWRLQVTTESARLDVLANALQSTAELAKHSGGLTEAFRVCFDASAVRQRLPAAFQSDLGESKFKLTHRVGKSGIARNEPSSDVLVEYYKSILDVTCFEDQSAEASILRLINDIQRSQNPEVLKIRPGILLAEELRTSGRVTSDHTAMIQSWCESNGKTYDDAIHDGTNALIALIAAYPAAEDEVLHLISSHKKSLSDSLLACQSRPGHWLIAEQLSLILSRRATSPTTVSVEVKLVVLAGMAGSKGVTTTPKGTVNITLVPGNVADIAEISFGIDGTPSIANLRSHQK